MQFSLSLSRSTNFFYLKGSSQHRLGDHTHVQHPSPSHGIVCLFGFTSVNHEFHGNNQDFSFSGAVTKNYFSQ
jgi:hypothetical protein